MVWSVSGCMVCVSDDGREYKVVMAEEVCERDGQQFLD